MQLLEKVFWTFSDFYKLKLVLSICNNYKKVIPKNLLTISRRKHFITN